MLREIADLEKAHAATNSLRAKWQAAKWRAAFSSSGGATWRQISRAKAQRFANAQPMTRSLPLGTAPGISASFRAAPASDEPSFGTALSRP
jgi:hypothetical protein